MARVTKSGEKTYDWDVDATRDRYGWMLSVFTHTQKPFCDIDIEILEIEDEEEDDWSEVPVVRAMTQSWEMYLV